MKFKNFLDIARTNQQAYFKDGVELLYPDQSRVMHIAILPAYNPKKPDPTGWVPAVDGSEENGFYTTVRASKFVGHGNRRAKVSFLSPRTFDLNADDPYEAFYDYCSRSDRWSYLTKDRRGKRLTGEVEGAVIPRMKNFFVANVMDVDAGTRGGVFVTELSESAGKNILYSIRKNGSRVDGLAFQRDDDGKLVFGDITDPRAALVIEVAWTGKGYLARPTMDSKGRIWRVEIPSTLLQHRKHMEEPGTFISMPESGQEVVDRLAGMLRGYRSDDGFDEIEALKEAMKFAYGDKYHVDENVEEKDDPFAKAARKTAEAHPAEKAEAVGEAVQRGVDRERYTPVNPERPVSPVSNVKMLRPDAPGEVIDPSDIAAMRAMLSGGK